MATDQDFDGIIDPAADANATVPLLSTRALAYGGPDGAMNAQAIALTKRLKALEARDAGDVPVDDGSGGSLFTTVQGFLDNQRTLRNRAPSFIAGDEVLSGAALRDAYVVGRRVEGDTNCHAFADRTVIDNVTDAGTYGTFDATTELYGSHTQNHVYAFQDRVRYRGSGTLTNSIGFYSSTIHSGSGTVTNRYGMMIDEMAKTGGGTITNQIGILINPLTSGTNNVAINAAQTVGWTLYAGGGAKSYHGGQLGVGAEPIAGAKLYVSPDTFGNLPVGIRVEQPNAWSYYGTGAGKFYQQGASGFGVEPAYGAIDFASPGGSTGFMSSDATAVSFGAVGDKTIRFITGGDMRLLLDATTYTFKPYGDNTQNLGAASFRWATVYAGTGTINTSDEREKQQIAELTEAEKRVGLRLKDLIRTFRFNDSVEAKADGARVHFGVVAQRVKEAFEAEGLDGTRYGVLCYDEWPELVETWGDEWHTIDPVYHETIVDVMDRPLLLEPGRRELKRAAGSKVVREAGNRWGVRESEAMWLILASIEP